LCDFVASWGDDSAKQSCPGGGTHLPNSAEDFITIQNCRISDLNAVNLHCVEEEERMYAGIRQAKAKAGMVEELTRRIKEGAIPLISEVSGFNAYYVIYAPDDTVMAISIFNDYAAAEESNRRALAWIETELAPLLAGPTSAVAGPVIVHTLA
jgi:hypothetical protein